MLRNSLVFALLALLFVLPAFAQYTPPAATNGVQRLYSSTSAVLTGANTDITIGQTFTLPAGLLNSPGRAIRATWWGTTAANANDKTVFLEFGEDNVYNTGAVAANAKPWWFTMTAINDSPGACTCDIVGFFNDTPVYVHTTTTTSEATAITIQNDMQNGTANVGDVRTYGMLLEYLP